MYSDSIRIQQSFKFFTVKIRFIKFTKELFHKVFYFSHSNHYIYDFKLNFKLTQGLMSFNFYLNFDI